MREIYVEFGGDPSDDKELYKRYCSSEKFTPLDIHGMEVIRFIDYTAHENMKRELDQLKKLLNKIALMGSGEKAYTADFTNYVNSVVRSTLEELGEEK